MAFGVDDFPNFPVWWDMLYSSLEGIDVFLQVAHVMLADFKAPLLPADACSRDGNKVLPYQREAVPWQEP